MRRILPTGVDVNELTGTRAFLTLSRTVLGADAVLSFMWLDDGTAVVRHTSAGAGPLAESLDKEPLIISMPRAELDAAGGVVFETRFPRLWITSTLRRRLLAPPTAVLIASANEEAGARSAGGLLALWLTPEARTRLPEPVFGIGDALRQPITILLADDAATPMSREGVKPAVPREESVDDALTGLLSRRGFKMLVHHDLLVARRTRRADAMLLIDVRNLRSINDGFGRLAGDEVLRRVGSMLRDTARDSDVVARVGGDEFAVFALECEGSVLANRIVTALAAHNARAAVARGHSIEITIGVAPSTTGEEYDVVMAEAEAALAQAQSARRERHSYDASWPNVIS